MRFGKLALATLFVLTVSQAQAQNLIINPGFETGSLSPWFQDRNLDGSEDWTVTSAVSHSGTFSATDIGNKEIRQNFTPTAASTITEVSFWLEHPTESQQPAFVSLFYTDGSNTGFTVTTPDTNFDFFDVTSNLDTTKVLSGFSIFGYSRATAPTTTYLDDVRVLAPAAVPEPGSIALLTGLSLTGAAFLRRRKQARKAA